MTDKPANVTHEQAVALVFGGQTAIHFLKNTLNLKSGQTILINGASGAVGTASIQLARYLGAQVTGVCSTSNIELLYKLGAKEVIDYTTQSVCSQSQQYDVILDAVGNLSSSQCRKALRPAGRLVLLNTGLLTTLSALFDKRLVCGAAADSKASLDFLRERIEAEDMRAVIDRSYTLEHIVEAHRYVDQGQKKAA